MACICPKSAAGWKLNTPGPRVGGEGAASAAAAIEAIGLAASNNKWAMTAERGHGGRVAVDGERGGPPAPLPSRKQNGRVGIIFSSDFC